MRYSLIAKSNKTDENSGMWRKIAVIANPFGEDLTEDKRFELDFFIDSLEMFSNAIQVEHSFFVSETVITIYQTLITVEQSGGRDI